jgi:hypothetical protein
MKSVIKVNECPPNHTFPSLKTNKDGDVILITNYSNCDVFFSGTVVSLSPNGSSFTLGLHSCLWSIDHLDDFHGEVILSSD